MSEEINNDRRRFLGTAMLTVATARYGMASISSTTINRMSAGEGIMTAPSGGTFDSLKQIDAGVLNVGYAEAGPPNGPAVVLLHGWPYDIHAFADVAPLLAARGYRVIVPYLRGSGTTRFLSDDTVRNGEQAVIAVDTIALQRSGQRAAMMLAVRAPQSKPPRIALSILSAFMKSIVSTASADGCPFRTVAFDRKRVVP